jgi:tetratricopeptide (TPR) repeat protein
MIKLIFESKMKQNIYRNFLLISILFSLTAIVSTSVLAQEQKVKKKSEKIRIAQRAAAPSDYKSGLEFFRKKEYLKSAVLFHKVGYKSPNTDEKTKVRAKYYLGLALVNLKLNQVATVPLIVAAKQSDDPEVRRKSLNMIIKIADKIDDPKLLRFALENLDVSKVSDVSKEVFYILLGEQHLQAGRIKEATESFEKALTLDSKDLSAMYRMGLAYLKLQQPRRAAEFFKRMYSYLENRKVTNAQRGLAIISVARANYQMKNYPEAAEWYKLVPKDHPFYRESQLELAWTHFRSIKFRSALSVIETLHTPYYDNYWDPESLTLRSILLMFICQADEAEKAIQTFDKLYNSSYQTIYDFIVANPDPQIIWQEISRARTQLKKIKERQNAKSETRLPFFLIRTILDEPKVRLRLRLLDDMDKEKAILEIYKSETPFLSEFGKKIIEKRTLSIRRDIANEAKAEVSSKLAALADYSTQMEFINYENISLKKELMKVKMSNSANGNDSAEFSRKVFVENGYRYWPFQGEYWRDEIGNYQYFGRNLCETIEQN